jgi:ketosteroid isomerase-like protein
MIMATRYAADEAEIRAVIDRLVEGIRTADLDALRTVFTTDVVSFDVASPLRDVGVDAKLRNWAQAFAVFQPPIGYDVRDLTVVVGDGVAYAHGINRLSGARLGPWVRWTAGFRKIDGSWRIAHDQVSVPVDPIGGKALLDLQP